MTKCIPASKQNFAHALLKFTEQAATPSVRLNITAVTRVCMHGTGAGISFNAVTLKLSSGVSSSLFASLQELVCVDRNLPVYELSRRAAYLLHGNATCRCFALFANARTFLHITITAFIRR